MIPTEALKKAKEQLSHFPNTELTAPTGIYTNGRPQTLGINTSVLIELIEEVLKGRPVEETFHTHLDRCPSCANNPLNLCSEGAKLLKAAAKGAVTKGK